MKKMLVVAMLTIAFVSQAHAQSRGGVGERAGRSEAVRARETRENARGAAQGAQASSAGRSAIESTIAKIRQLRDKGLTEQGLERDFAARMMKDAGFTARVDSALKSGSKEEITVLKLEILNSKPADGMALTTKGADYQIARESSVNLVTAVKQSKSWTGTAATSKATLDVFVKNYVANRAKGENELTAMENAARATESATGKKIEWKKIRELCKA